MVGIKWSKVVNPGTDQDGKQIFCNIQYDGRRLSITGVVGPTARGNAVACGQIVDEVKECIQHSDWTPEMLAKFVAIWNKWHLNDTRAGSPMQMEFLEKMPIEDYTNYYDIASKRLELAGLNPDPNYLHNGKPYAYGNAWLSADVPVEALQFLYDLPDTKRKPAWV